ncbi:MAG TPA: putative toxin-antitoxin system toxin component, PIN family [Bacteroidia bacterium]|nr:putative toxin-antitoxin system toxin component, PIN family [Bacteroidia bacterium]
MANKPTRIAIDTNIWISFLINGKNFSKLDKLIQADKIKLIFSDELLLEFLEVVERPKFKKYFSTDNIQILFENIQNQAEFIKVKQKVDVCRDKKDNFLLALSEVGAVDFLITGDEDLLVLKKYKKTKIVRISDFLSSK